MSDEADKDERLEIIIEITIIRVHLILTSNEISYYEPLFILLPHIGKYTVILHSLQKTLLYPEDITESGR